MFSISSQRILELFRRQILRTPAHASFFRKARTVEILLYCIVLVGSANAAPREPASKAREEELPRQALEKELPRQALEKELEPYKRLESLEAHFHQTKEMKGLGLHLPSSGHFRLEKKQGHSEIEWQVSEPSYLKLWITEKSLEMSDQAGKPGKPLLENQEAAAKVLRPLYAWLSMNSGLIEEQYRIFAAGPHRYRLQPKDTASPVKALTLALDQRHLVHHVTLEERSGDELSIIFSDAKAVFAP